MPRLPVLPVVLPTDLAGQRNGQLEPNLLVDVHGGGQLHHLAAKAWQNAVDACARIGVSLTYTYGGMYRTLEQQTSLFEQRYTRTPMDRPFKTWNGHRWYQRPGVAMAATPGTSNHGLGLAIDMAIGTHPREARYIASHPQFGEITKILVDAGFSFEAQSEPWHVRLVCGDDVPEPKPDAPDGAAKVEIKDRPTLRRGATGEDVKFLQRCLAKDGRRILVDGIFGPKTEGTVKRFQKSRGLIVDGIVGQKQTWPAINEVAIAHNVT